MVGLYKTFTKVAVYSIVMQSLQTHLTLQQCLFFSTQGLAGAKPHIVITILVCVKMLELQMQTPHAD